MHRDTNQPALPDLTTNLIREQGCLIDNLFADLWQQVGMKTLLCRAGFRKRSGTPIHELIYCLMLWVWLKVDSIGVFARESLQSFSQARKDALYDVMNREDLNWRRLNLQVVAQAVRMGKAQEGTRAFVLDDSIKKRYGKKMPGVSSHFDHTSGRHVIGQQVLTLGLSTASGFLPVDSELFISAVKAQALDQPFRDGRSVVAKRYRVAQGQTKPQMARDMIARAQRNGIDAEYLLGDAWFGTKAMIRVADEACLRPILRMKKNKMKYRLKEWKDGKAVFRELNVKALYRMGVRKQWQKIPGQSYQAKTLEVELNLSEDEQTQWTRVRLLFVRGTADREKAQAGKHDWAVFLTTDLSLEPGRILELYALRWAIEVYFKEAKQHLGWLKEQSNHYGAYVASIHLAAIRFCLLMIARQQHDFPRLSDIRQAISTNVQEIDFAARLWQVFQALITGAMEELKQVLGDAASQVMETIERHIQGFFVQALQLDPRILRLESS